MAIGDGIRRDIAKVSQVERDRFIAAILQLDTAKFSGDGVSYWDKQEDIHKNAHLAGVDVHAGPGSYRGTASCATGSRSCCARSTSTCSLHYSNSQPTRATRPAAGSTCSPATSWVRTRATPGRRCRTSSPRGRRAHPHLAGGLDSATRRSVRRSASPTRRSAAPLPGRLRQRIQQVHSDAHGYIGGTITQAHYSFHDPFVFLLHSNIDRLYSMWQTPSPATPSGSTRPPSTTTTAPTPVSTARSSRRAGNLANPSLQLRPWAPPENQQVVKTYKDPSVVAPC